MATQISRVKKNVGGYPGSMRGAIIVGGLVFIAMVAAVLIWPNLIAKKERAGHIDKFQQMQVQVDSLKLVDVRQDKEDARQEWRSNFLLSVLNGGMITLQDERALPVEIELRVSNVVFQNPLAPSKEILLNIMAGFTEKQLDSLAFACRLSVDQMIGKAVVLAGRYKKLGASPTSQAQRR